MGDEKICPFQQIVRSLREGAERRMMTRSLLRTNRNSPCYQKQHRNWLKSKINRVTQSFPIFCFPEYTICSVTPMTPKMVWSWTWHYRGCMVTGKCLWATFSLPQGAWGKNMPSQGTCTHSHSMGNAKTPFSLPTCFKAVGGNQRKGEFHKYREGKGFEPTTSVTLLPSEPWRYTNTASLLFIIMYFFRKWWLKEACVVGALWTI